ncbi:hypothetical protein [Halomicronema sp. CCY15110]|uniref:hypothetical protein n=1 Tax=Halomicronema sp. CCY15110 TaxID=2767773 RepID=UPI0019509A98|nr:hypothetical protein [Halomicronema sp. CCY15110]
MGLSGTIEVAQQDELGDGRITGVMDDNIDVVSGEKSAIAGLYRVPSYLAGMISATLFDRWSAGRHPVMSRRSC